MNRRGRTWRHRTDAERRAAKSLLVALRALSHGDEAKKTLRRGGRGMGRRRGGVCAIGRRRGGNRAPASRCRRCGRRWIASLCCCGVTHMALNAGSSDINANACGAAIFVRIRFGGGSKDGKQRKDALCGRIAYAIVNNAHGVIFMARARYRASKRGRRRNACRKTAGVLS